MDKVADRLNFNIDPVDVNLTLGDPTTLIDQGFQRWRTMNITAAIVTADPIFHDHLTDVIHPPRRTQ